MIDSISFFVSLSPSFIFSLFFLLLFLSFLKEPCRHFFVLFFLSLPYFCTSFPFLFLFSPWWNCKRTLLTTWRWWWQEAREFFLLIHRRLNKNLALTEWSGGTLSVKVIFIQVCSGDILPYYPRLHCRGLATSEPPKLPKIRVIFRVMRFLFSRYCNHGRQWNIKNNFSQVIFFLSRVQCKILISICVWEIKNLNVTYFPYEAFLWWGMHYQRARRKTVCLKDSWYP